MLTAGFWTVVVWVAVVWALILGCAIVGLLAVWACVRVRACIENRMYASGR